MCSKRFKEDSSFIFICDIYCSHLLHKYVGIQRHISLRSLTGKRHGPTIQLYSIRVNHALVSAPAAVLMMIPLIHRTDFDLNLQEILAENLWASEASIPKYICYLLYGIN